MLCLSLLAAGPAVVWALGAKAGWWNWPAASSPVGVFLGFAAGVLVFFEMLIWPRKWFRGTRLGPTRSWLRLHVWLGLLSLPITLIHSGFALGGTLSAATLVLFLVVIVSGIWGLILQQWLPQKILDDVPNETVAGLSELAMRNYAAECRQLVLNLSAGGEVHAEKVERLPTADGGVYDSLSSFQSKLLEPYLERGRHSGSMLRSRGETARQYGRLRTALPSAAQPVLARMESLTDLRRQWDVQMRMTGWLHGWLLVHLPASVAMTAFMCFHAVAALKYW
ncbi:MAG TPA: hypothetical protein VGJ05_10275 [Fimbriiglobus sp.]